MATSAQDGFARLTDGQRECLRLVLTRQNSKEIALQLGISSHTVDQRLRVAMQTLGASSRFEAARMLAAREDDARYQRAVYQAPDVADRPVPATVATSLEQEPPGNTSAAVREDQAAFVAFSTGQSWMPNLPLERRGGRNSLTSYQRLGLILAITVGVALSFGVFVVGVESLGEMGARIYRQIAT